MTTTVRVIADDVTGATDIADTLSRIGRRVLVTIGVPAQDLSLDGFDAVVVALKTRTAPVADAVAESVHACDWLSSRARGQLIFKVCSTFDSTSEGNIGPVADALLDRLGADTAVVCPAMPANRRTVYMGHLFVGDRLLHESPMADHPLTPMRDSDVVRLLQRQSRRRVGLIGYPTVQRGSGAIRTALDELRAVGTQFAVVDALDNDDLREIATGAADVALWVSGSGLAGGIPTAATLPPAAAEPPRTGPAAVIAGSTSLATRRQVESFARSAPAVRLEPARLLDEAGYVDALAREAVHHVRRSGRVLVYSSAPPDEVARAQSRGPAGSVAARVERALAQVSGALVEAAGVQRLVVAGGETSGAVLRALGVTALAVGPTIAPGVPWTTSVGSAGLSLALKSGNFGDPDFFADALGSGHG